MDFTTVYDPVVNLIYKGRLRRKFDPLVDLPIDMLLKDGKSIIIKVENS